MTRKTRHGSTEQADTLENGYPTRQMLFAKKAPEISENKIAGSYKNVGEYLEVQYDLLLEDFLFPLRQALKDFKNYPNCDTFDGARLHRRISLKPSKQIRGGLEIATYILSGFPTSAETIEDMPSFGRLLLFTKADFKKDLFLGKVISDWEKTGQIEVEVKQFSGEKRELERGTFTVMEAKAFYYKYECILRALEEFNEENFPMKEYIVYGMKANHYPTYIRNNTVYNVFGNTVHVVLDKTWSSNESMQMDKPQCSALRKALTRKVAVIQGPPGTGKTYFGVRMVKVLLDNVTVWNPFLQTPIVVVCQSNAALDHFLEGLLPFTNRLVRVGDKSQSKDLKPYFLNDQIDDFMEKEKSRARRMPRGLAREKVLKRAYVVGMTTTGASSRRDILRQLQSPILVVEEAAEVLESNVIASMTEFCQHLILLGDHKQLKPIVTTHHLGTDFYLDISLFERLLTNEVVKKSCLTTQYRMRPQISSLLKPHIYEHLDDAPGTLERPPVKGVTKSVVFLHHDKAEGTSDGKSGFFNDHEAKMLILLAKYLVSVGYLTSQITIIAMYLEQRKKLEKERDQFKVLEGLEIASVDSFQGKENHIILVSLVRNNKGGNIGFLKEPNRVCVAISRAKDGMFIMGNINCLSKDQWKKNIRVRTVWTDVRKKLVELDAVSPHLTLFCEKHKSSLQVSEVIHWNDEFCTLCSEERLEEKRKRQEARRRREELKWEAERLRQEEIREAERLRHEKIRKAVLLRQETIREAQRLWEAERLREAERRQEVERLRREQMFTNRTPHFYAPNMSNNYIRPESSESAPRKTVIRRVAENLAYILCGCLCGPSLDNVW